MSITGIVFERQEVQIAVVEVNVTANYQSIEVSVNDNLVIMFPLPLTADVNEIALRTTNVINQTGLVANSVRVEITETP